VAELVLVRHAQASFHAEDYDCLSALGERQSVWLGEHFAALGKQFDLVVTGSLRRHAQTVEGVFKGLGRRTPGPCLQHPGLDEYDFRALVEAFEAGEPTHPLVLARRADPRDKSAYYRVLRLALAAWAARRLPGTLQETWEGFRVRVEAAAQWLQELAATHARILAVSSGGAMSTLLGGRLGIDWERIVELNLQIRNTSVSQFFLNRERFLLASWNAVPHLEVPGRAEAITYG
jgi:broad specificity phosphatase PhoE